MRSSTWGWAAAAVITTTAAAAIVVVLLPPLRRRLRHPSLAREIPLGAFLGFEVAVRVRAWLHARGGVSRALTPLPDVEVLGPGVIRVLGRNPGRMTLQGTNTYLLGTGPRRLLLDASDGNDAYVDSLLRVCAAHGVTEITDLVITHGHMDHIGGVLRLREAFPALAAWKYMPEDDRTLRFSNAQCRALQIRSLPLTKVFAVPGSATAVLRCEYMPGHCADHVCFVLEDPTAPPTQHRTLFSGDCILGEGSCVFDSLRDLIASLRRLRSLAPDVIYPAHGPVVHEAVLKIDEYLTHRLQREEEIVRCLAAASNRALSARELVQGIYEKLPFLLRLAAQKAVDKHLDKLVHDGRVERLPGRSWVSPATYRLLQQAHAEQQ